MTVSKLEGWLFSGGDETPGVAKPGIVALLTHGAPPASAKDSTIEWLEIYLQVDGMHCGVLEALILPLPVPSESLQQLLKATDWSDTNWRTDLSWHNTELDTPADPTVSAYVDAISGIGLAWTPSAELTCERYGWKLAQAVYPLDPTDGNLRALGVAESMETLLGEPVDTDRHALVLLTPNDD